jgi:O-6-methylguanine DNA methyltransferase
MSSTLYKARFDSPIGALTVTSSDAGLCYVALPRASGRGLGGWQNRHAPGARIVDGYEPNRDAIAQLTEFLDGKRERFDLALDLRATPFQLEVYDVVAAIPYGESLSYAAVAERIGRPAAVRAVGAANGANPIPLVIPCHRVVAKSGQLQGYAGGLRMKAKLLAMESASHPSQGALL